MSRQPIPKPDVAFLTRDVLRDVLIWCYENDYSDIRIKTNHPISGKLYGRWSPIFNKRINTNEMSEIVGATYGLAGEGILSQGRPLNPSYEIRVSDNLSYRFRVNITSTGGNGFDRCAIIRTIPYMPPSVEDIGVENEILDYAYPKEGMVLVGGATSMGKSTLLAAILRKYLEVNDGHLVTFESPIEFIYDNLKEMLAIVEQHEIPKDLPTFASGIEEALRMAPDAILMGEARDIPSITGSVSAANTGHKLYTTVHSSSCQTTLGRMAEFYPPDQRDSVVKNLIHNTSLIVNQSLLKTKDGKRVAVRSWVPFSRKVKDRLLSVNVMNIASEINKLMEEGVGRSFEQGVELVKDKIDEETYINLMRK